MMLRSLTRMVLMQYGFPPTVFEPGQETTLKVDVKDMFRCEKLIMHATMREIRGHFKLKRSRIPPLDREDIVCAYTKIRMWRRGRRIKYYPTKTVVEYRGTDERYDKPFTREYLPTSVVYIPVDAAQYMVLENVYCGAEAQMPSFEGSGINALFFGPASLANGVLFSSTDVSISLKLKNIGDVQVKFFAAALGRSYR